MSRNAREIQDELMRLTREIVDAAKANDEPKLRALKRKQSRLLKELQQTKK